MKTKTILVTLLSMLVVFAFTGKDALAIDKKIIDLSINSCWGIYSTSYNKVGKVQKTTLLGSGFFISEDHIVTCLHVVSSNFNQEKDPEKIKLYPGLVAGIVRGNKLYPTQVEFVTKLDKSSREPLEFDFAILKLKGAPKIPHGKLSLDSGTSHRPAIGQSCLAVCSPTSNLSEVHPDISARRLLW